MQNNRYQVHDLVKFVLFAGTNRGELMAYGGYDKLNHWVNVKQYSIGVIVEVDKGEHAYNARILHQSGIVLYVNTSNVKRLKK